MVSKRQRSNTNINSQLSELSDTADQLSKASSRGIGVDAVGGGNLQENSVGSREIKPGSVDGDALGRGAVGTENLGIVDEINAGGDFNVNTPGQVMANGIPVVDFTDSATTSLPGISELATNAETISGTDATRTVTPAGLLAAVNDTTGVGARATAIEAKLATLPDYSLRVPIPTTTRVRSRNSPYYGNERDPTQGFWVTKSSGGVVTIEGLGTGFNAIAAGVVIGTLPVGYRPATTERYVASANGSIRAQATVATNGDITVNVALASTDYLSLSNVVFLEASVANALTWTTPTLNTGAGWAAVSGKVPQWAVDSYGVVWLRGQATKAGTWVDNQRVFNIPAPYQASKFQHFSASSSTAYCYAAMEGTTTGGGGGAAGDLLSKGAAAGTNLSFAGIFYAPSSLDSSFSLIGGTNYSEPLGDVAFASSWQSYGSPFMAGALWRRPDGFCILRGLTSAGTIAASMFTLPPGMRPQSRLFFERPSNAATGLLIVASSRPVDSSITGFVLPNSGSNAWFSIDSVGFNAGGG